MSENKKNHQKGSELNIWQDKCLPPIEYCSVERAARLLGCEVEDLQHWAVIGAIDLAFEIPQIPANLHVVYKEGVNSSVDKDDSPVLLSNRLGFGKSNFVLKLPSDHPNSFEPPYQPFEGGLMAFGRAFGIWKFRGLDLSRLDKIAIIKNSPMHVVPVSYEEQINYVGLYWENSAPVEINFHDLLVLRSDIEALWVSAKNGQPMPSYITGERQDPDTNDLNVTKDFKPSSTLKNLVAFLVASNPELGPEILQANPHAAKAALERFLMKIKKNGTPELKSMYADYKIPDYKTLKNYLDLCD